VSDTEPVFLTLAEVLEIHADQLRLFGGSEGIRDQGALESAIATPEATFAGAFLHETLWEMAAAYAFHIAQNQPFLDGNKRVGLNACLLFLALNGWEVNDPTGALYDAMIAFAEGTLKKPGLADILRSLAIPLDSFEP
jgi:death on curing protein